MLPHSDNEINRLPNQYFCSISAEGSLCGSSEEKILRSVLAGMT